MIIFKSKISREKRTACRCYKNMNMKDITFPLRFSVSFHKMARVPNLRSGPARWTRDTDYYQTKYIPDIPTIRPVVVISPTPLTNPFQTCRCCRRVNALFRREAKTFETLNKRLTKWRQPGLLLWQLSIKRSSARMFI